MVFLILRMQVSAPHDSTGEGVAEFVAAVYQVAAIPRNLALFVLAMGVATTAFAVALMFAPSTRRLPRAQALVLIALGIPALAFWAPVHGVTRHLLPVCLAVALFIGLVVSRSGRAPTVLAVALLLPVANQILPELAYPIVAHRYPWSNPNLPGRRISTAAPLGAFPMDHSAKQHAYTLFRDEGRAFARNCSGRVLVFAEESDYILLSLIEGDRTVRLSSVEASGHLIWEALGTHCTLHIVQKPAPQPTDLVRDFLKMDRYREWPMYFQEATRNAYDRTEVPRERRYCIDDAASRECADTTGAGALIRSLPTASDPT
jgi:hypothetical protein